MQMAAAKPETERRRITVLGSTGSVGCNTIDLIDRNPDAYEIEALTAYSNVPLLAEQAKRLRPRQAVIGDAGKYKDLKAALSGTGVDVAAGATAVAEAGARPADWVMSAIVGAAGLEATLAAVRRGAVVALANKETLVCAGDLIMAEIARHGAVLLPVDSEHSAIFQVFDFKQKDAVEKIILTASGGPFRTTDRAAMAKMTPKQAVAHPNWDMGAKISVDSATMMNKGLELIEAHHLFALPGDQIDIVVHPQSVIHSLVAYRDGSVLAQLGSPDMRTPIAYALGWPQRIDCPAKRLNLAEIASLTFEAPDPIRFPALRLAREALNTGGTAPTVLNAANEVAVAAFLKEKIGFLQIAEAVERTLEELPAEPLASLDHLRMIDDLARRTAATILEALPKA
jgi:1-deoxy-D-xylulose-5-phosphate reductoisomerase